jgi:hypothetical protein
MRIPLLPETCTIRLLASWVKKAFGFLGEHGSLYNARHSLFLTAGEAKS